jgi:hypothetical protein
VTTVLVSGAVANKHRHGGSVWVRMSWAEGLRALGFDVVFVEELRAPEPAATDAFHAVMAEFGFTGAAALVCPADGTVSGMGREELLERAADAALLVNLTGHLGWQPLRERVRRAVYVDLDPGYTQVWSADGHDLGLAGHDLHFTVGLNVGTARCPLPSGAIAWRPVRQPVVLERWPVAPGDFTGFTTVASWRGAYGPLDWAGRTLGPKAHEFRRVAGVPRASGLPFAAVLDIHPADAADRERLLDGGWDLLDPAEAGTPADFARFVRGSGAEFSPAQGVYVHTRSGWFSDRTVRYLASGRPALVQDTGFGAALPVGEGLLAYATPAEAVTRAQELAADHARHAAAARRIAEEHFAHDRALAPLLEAAEVAP